MGLGIRIYKDKHIGREEQRQRMQCTSFKRLSMTIPTKLLEII